MSDQRFMSADAAPRLTSHLRALSLIAPLQRAEDNKGMLHVSAKAAERVDILLHRAEPNRKGRHAA